METKILTELVEVHPNIYEVVDAIDVHIWGHGTTRPTLGVHHGEDSAQDNKLLAEPSSHTVTSRACRCSRSQPTMVYAQHKPFSTAQQMSPGCEQVVVGESRSRTDDGTRLDGGAAWRLDASNGQPFVGLCFGRYACRCRTCLVEALFLLLGPQTFQNDHDCSTSAARGGGPGLLGKLSHSSAIFWRLMAYLAVIHAIVNRLASWPL